MPKVARAVQIGLSLLLAGCVPAPTLARPTPTPPAAVPSASAPPTASPTPGRAANSLRVWLPPQFAPDVNLPAGLVLAEQIAQFEQAHPGETVQVRLKQVSGPGGLLQALIATYNAAPAALPDLIALQRDDLATAASAGLVIPLDKLLPPETFADYYPFAQAMGRRDGEWVGLPFAADAHVLAYRTDVFSTPPRMWTDVTAGTLILPGAETSGLTVLNEYLALGGTLADDSGATALDPAKLADALAAFQALQTSGRLPLSTLTYADAEATWQVFRERRATLAVTSVQWYMAEQNRLGTAAVTLMPTSEGKPLALAEGWSWAVVNTAAERHRAAAELLDWLVAPDQLSAWTQAAGFLPPRASALAAWGEAPVAPSASDILTHAQLQPSIEILALVGPPLHQALDDVLNGRATPFAAAALAAQTVANP